MIQKRTPVCRIMGAFQLRITALLPTTFRAFLQHTSILLPYARHIPTWRPQHQSAFRCKASKIAYVIGLLQGQALAWQRLFYFPAWRLVLFCGKEEVFLTMHRFPEVKSHHSKKNKYPFYHITIPSGQLFQTRSPERLPPHPDQRGQ